MNTVIPISQIVLEHTFKEEDWELPALPKQKDTRGFIYVVKDSKYPHLIKVGRTTDFVKRVKQYNVDRPFEDVYPILCTNIVANAHYMEKVIKDELIRKFSSVGKSEEWFSKEAIVEIYKILEITFGWDYKLFNEDGIDE